MPSKDELDPATSDEFEFGNDRTEHGERPLDRDPDATVELVASDPEEMGVFQHYVASHLVYQVRDCFLQMGVKPPVAFRAQGQGKYRAALEQRFLPQYENYWDATATIDSWTPQ